jgi:TetR/AcrR family fatty acid metabolism transcriptional regulator
LDDITSERTEKRTLLLSAAQEVFAEKGFHSAKVETIAERAGVAKGTVYLYFPSKKDILTALIEDRIGRLIAQIKLATGDTCDSLEVIRKVIAAHFGFYSNHKEFITLLYGQLGQIAEGMEGPAKRSYEQLTRMITNVLTRGIEEGVLRQTDIPMLTQALQGMIHAVAFEWVVHERTVEPAQVAHSVFELFCTGALRHRP